MKGPNRASTDSIDGLIPRAAAYPSSEGEVAAVLRAAHESGLRTFISGGRTRAQWGRPVEGLDLVLSTIDLKGDVDLRIDDLTATVPAGMRLMDLDALLTKQGLFLPLDPSGTASTVGGAVATASSSYQRATYGTARDVVLGMRMVLPTGQVMRFGGRTVKNVSGYDLCKVATGSWGTLGCITEITLRLYAFPPASGTVAALLGEGTVLPAVQAVFDDQVTPAAFEVMAGVDPSELAVFDYAGTLEAKYILLARFSGPPAGVEAQCGDIARKVIAAGAAEAYCLTGEDEANLWRRRLDIYNSLGSAGVRISTSAPPGAWAQTLAAVSAFAAGNRLGLKGSVMPLNGVAAFEVSEGAESGDGLSGIAGGLLDLGRCLGEADCLLRVISGPLSVRKAFYSQWAASGATARLALGMKRLFDPGMILAPGKIP